MEPARKLLGAARAATPTAAAVGVRVARSLYSRWRTLPAADRRRTEPLAEDTKRRALELRGSSDSETARRELQGSSETLAAAIVESAEDDPELDEIEVRRLRDDLRRELERLATADVRASRGEGSARRDARRS